MWSRGHKARGRGQGHKKNSRPRTALPRTDPLDTKDRNAQVEAKATDQGHTHKCSQKKGLPKTFQAISKKNGLQKFFQAISNDL